MAYFNGAYSFRTNRHRPTRGDLAQPSERKPLPESLSAEDREKIERARIRPAAPELIRELTQRGLMQYV